MYHQLKKVCHDWLPWQEDTDTHSSGDAITGLSSTSGSVLTRTQAQEKSSFALQAMGQSYSRTLKWLMPWSSLGSSSNPLINPPAHTQVCGSPRSGNTWYPWLAFLSACILFFPGWLTDDSPGFSLFKISDFTPFIQIISNLRFCIWFLLQMSMKLQS